MHLQSTKNKYGVNEQQRSQSNGQCNSKTTVKYRYDTAVINVTYLIDKSTLLQHKSKLMKIEQSKLKLLTNESPFFFQAIVLTTIPTCSTESRDRLNNIMPNNDRI